MSDLEYQTCAGYGDKAQNITVLKSSGRWGTAICPVCGKKVSATRPTRRIPYSMIGMHTVRRLPLESMIS